MTKLDIEGIVRLALKERKDPHLEVMKEMNKRNLERDPSYDTWAPKDRSLIKMFVIGFLYSRSLEIDRENWTLKEVVDA